MISIFNRRELTITFSMAEQAKIRDILATNNIDYKLNVINRSNPTVMDNTRAKMGTFGQNMDLAYEYVFYVHKNDYELGKALIVSM